jgi:hypothetical protein
VILAFIADTHLHNHPAFGLEMRGGINRRAQMILDAIASAKARALKLGATLVVLGDVFDTVRPPPQLIAALQKILAEGPNVIIKGNHDMVSTQVGDHSLGPLGAGIADVIEEPTVLRLDGCELWCVPFQPGPARDWLPVVLAELSAAVQGRSRSGQLGSLPRRVLALHLGLQASDTPVYLQGSPDSVTVDQVDALMDQYNISFCIAGNWHGHQVYEGRIAQCGTLAPTGFDNPGLEGYGSLCLYDTEKDKFWREEIPGPRFVKVRTPEDLDALQGNVNHVLAKLITGPQKMPDLFDRAVDMVSLKQLVDFLMETDEAQRTAAARAAAYGAQHAASNDEAIAAFIERQPMDRPELRVKVLEAVKNYLVRAS